jgi:hypothetical protein
VGGGDDAVGLELARAVAAAVDEAVAIVAAELERALADPDPLRGGRLLRLWV